MKRETYVYNTQTLRYEKVELSWKERLLRIFGFVCAVLVAGIVFTLLIWKFFPSPREQMLLREIEHMKAKYAELEQSYNLMDKALANLHERDRLVHRMVLEMDPMDESVWEGGVGGHERYAELLSYPNSGKLLAEIQQKVDRLKRQLVLQSRSLEEIEKKAREKEKMLASIPSIKPVRSDKLARDVKLLSGFGYRIHPIYKVRKMHTGIDFTAPRGTPIQATGDGVVVKVERKRTGYGNHVVIDHGYGYKTLYGHMQRIDVKVGQRVKKGQQIGVVGSTGTSTAPHCHYEVHYKGKKVNPIHYVMDGLTPEEYAELVRMAEVANQSFD
ncbi:MAG: M23 family metallopeptidase [Bacteroidetes bacterium]|nr:MAG: M23 family metallopeptidase [Bacteroidota bacterium]